MAKMAPRQSAPTALLPVLALTLALTLPGTLALITTEDPDSPYGFFRLPKGGYFHQYHHSGYYKSYDHKPRGGFGGNSRPNVVVHQQSVYGRARYDPYGHSGPEERLPNIDFGNGIILDRSQGGLVAKDPAVNKPRDFSRDGQILRPRPTVARPTTPMFTFPTLDDSDSNVFRDDDDGFVDTFNEDDNDVHVLEPTEFVITGDPILTTLRIPTSQEDQNEGENVEPEVGDDISSLEEGDLNTIDDVATSGFNPSNETDVGELSTTEASQNGTEIGELVPTEAPHNETEIDELSTTEAPHNETEIDELSTTEAPHNETEIDELSTTEAPHNETEIDELSTTEAPHNETEIDELSTTEAPHNETEIDELSTTEAPHNETEIDELSTTEAPHNETEIDELSTTEAPHNETEIDELSTTEAPHNETEIDELSTAESPHNETEIDELSTTESPHNETEIDELSTTEAPHNETEIDELSTTEASHHEPGVDFDVDISTTAFSNTETAPFMETTFASATDDFITLPTTPATFDSHDMNDFYRGLSPSKIRLLLRFLHTLQHNGYDYDDNDYDYSG